MSPWPILRTQLAITRVLLRRLAGQGPSLLVACVVVAASGALALILKGALLTTGGSFRPLGAGMVAQGVGLALALLLVATSGAGWLWRRSDRLLLAGEPLGRLPATLLLQASLYAGVIVGGAGVIIYAALEYAAPRLASLGLPAPWPTLVLAVPLAVAYGTLFLRLPLFLPLIGLDRQKVVPGWHLVLRTTIGKGLPLLGALAFQAVAIAPFALLFRALVLPSFHATPLASLSLSSLEGEPQAAALGVVLAGMALDILCVLQAATLRHFFGYGIGGDPRYDDEHMVIAGMEDSGAHDAAPAPFAQPADVLPVFEDRGLAAPASMPPAPSAPPFLAPPALGDRPPSPRAAGEEPPLLPGDEPLDDEGLPEGLRL
jgi:hypothetical protein